MLTVKRHNPLHWLALLSLAVGLLAGGAARAQDDAADLEELVGPVALYPDDLLAIALPASTYPLQVVQAARFLEERKSDPDLKPDEAWDDSVVALLNYPEIVAQMNDDLDWTWALGEAFINEQPAMMDAVQRFRERAVVAGNLKTDERQVVQEVEGAIEIEPADPEVIYVPYYEPARVVVRHYRPVYYYYPRAYPVYYYPYRYGYTFADDLFWGVTTYFAFNWVTHNLHSHHYSHYGHPYRGYTYRRPLYTRHHFRGNRVTHNYRRNNVWRPDRRHGARPRHGVRTWSGTRVARGDRRIDRRRLDGRRFDGQRRGDARPPRNRNQSRAVTNDRTQAHVNRNGNRSAFAPRNARPRDATPRRADQRATQRPTERRAGRDQRREQNRNPSGRQSDVSNNRSRNATSPRVTPQRQRNAGNDRVRVAQNGSPSRWRANVADTTRRSAPRQQRATPRQAAPRQAAPRRAAPARAQPRRAAPARSGAAPSQPRKQSRRGSFDSSRAAPRGQSRGGARSGARRR